MLGFVYFWRCQELEHAGTQYMLDMLAKCCPSELQLYLLFGVGTCALFLGLIS